MGKGKRFTSRRPWWAEGDKEQGLLASAADNIPVASLAGIGYALGDEPITHRREGAMRHLWRLAFALLVGLLLGPGCVSDGKKSPWDDFWKDLRGDYMEMGSHNRE